MASNKSNEKENSMKYAKKRHYCILLACCIAAECFLLVALYWQHRGGFPHHTPCLLGMDKGASGYILTITGKDGEKKELAAEEIGLQLLQDGAVSCDEGLLAQAVQWGLAAESQTLPEDAKIIWDGEKYVIHPEKEGAMLDVEKTLEAIRDAIENQKGEISLETEQCYLSPEVRSDNAQLQDACARLNLWAGSSITYSFGERSEIVDKTLIQGWILADGAGGYKLDEEAVAAYVHNLSKEYSNFGLPITFTTSYGDTIEVPGGDYGYLIDEEAEAQALVADIQNGAVTTREPAYIYAEGIGYCQDGVGDSYIEVSLDNQEMFLYVNGELTVRTSVVTGMKDTSDATPPGVWAIDAKFESATLIGQNYASPVEFWMPFWGDYGIHSAPWRTAFGGDIYMGNGSNGCVNTPTEAVCTIFQNVEAGYPVIVYMHDSN